jgi:quercetin dioxygenase-like cupin family protein
MKRILQTAEGDAVKLGPPAAGEVRIKVDPGTAGSPFAAGTQTLLPGSAMPVHRHLARDVVLWVHKGQGRAIVEGETMTVVPGALIHVPRQSWHELRNTGNGALQVVWLSAPSGLEEFFREYSRLGVQADPAAFQALAQRHGIEFRPEGQAAQAPAAVPQRHGRRRHRGGRGRRSRVGQTPQGSPKPQPQSRPQPSAPVQRPPEPRSARPERPHPEGRGGRRGGHRRSGRVKEVYMGGKWVRVVGEGPVISGG